MAIKFFNIRSGETQTAETEPQISAMWSSSDHSPNVSQGQDFGWRLAPAVVVEMKQIKQDPNILQQIATRINKPFEDITEPDVLGYISAKTAPQSAPVANNSDYSDVYDDEIRRLSRGDDETQTATTTEPEYPKVIAGIRYFTDGRQICAVHDASFINPMESPMGYGDTEEEALKAFRAAAGAEKGTTTTTTTKV